MVAHAGVKWVRVRPTSLEGSSSCLVRGVEVAGVAEAAV